jgi:hypothetical protein
MRRLFVLAGLWSMACLGGLSACGDKSDGVSGDPTLTNLSLSVGSLTPAFAPDVDAYAVAVTFADTTTTIGATATEVDAAITVNGAAWSNVTIYDLTEGVNIFRVSVTTTGGAAHVYTITVTRPSQANVAEQAYAKAFNTGARDQFGTSMALDGDTLVVGAPLEDSAETGTSGQGASNGASDSGAVYVFVRVAGVWSQEAYLKPSNTGAGDRFGSSVAISGNTLVVGAPSEDSAETGTSGQGTSNGAIDSGAAYVFTRTAGVWTQEAYLKASNTGAGDQFGWSVAISGDTLAVGAPLEDSAARTINGGVSDESNNGASNAGAAYVFVRSGQAWTQEAYVKPLNADPGDDFGVSVALSGDTLAVGATGEAGDGVALDPFNNLAPVSGAAYVFVRNAGVWTQQAYLKASNPNVSDTFGWRLALDGDTLAVSAPLEDSADHGVGADGSDNNAASAGAVYVFVRNGSNVWSQQAYLKASNPGSLDSFGWDLGLSGDRLAVGAPGEDSAGPGENNAVPVTNESNQSDNGLATAGAVYVFERSGTSWSQLDYLKASNPGSGDGFGVSVAVGGATVAAGAIQEDSAATGVGGDPASNAALDSGAAYVFQ